MYLYLRNLSKLKRFNNSNKLLFIKNYNHNLSKTINAIFPEHNECSILVCISMYCLNITGKRRGLERDRNKYSNKILELCSKWKALKYFSGTKAYNWCKFPSGKVCCERKSGWPNLSDLQNCWKWNNRRVPSFLLYVEIKLKSNVCEPRNNIKSAIDTNTWCSDWNRRCDFRKFVYRRSVVCSACIDTQKSTLCRLSDSWCKMGKSQRDLASELPENLLPPLAQ